MLSMVEITSNLVQRHLAWSYSPYKNLEQIDYKLHNHVFDDVICKPSVQILVAAIKYNFDKLPCVETKVITWRKHLPYTSKTPPLRDLVMMMWALSIFSNKKQRYRLFILSINAETEFVALLT